MRESKITKYILFSMFFSVVVACSSQSNNPTPVPTNPIDIEKKKEINFDEVISNLLDSREDQSSQLESIENLDQGNYKLSKITILSSLKKLDSKAESSYVHKLKKLGKIPEGDELNISGSLPPEFNRYDYSLKLNLPLGVDIVKNGIQSLEERSNVYYESSFWNSSNSSPSGHYSTHPDSKKGFSVFSIFNSQAQKKTTKNRVFFRSFIKDFPSEENIVYGYLEAIKGEKWHFLINVIFRNTDEDGSNELTLIQLDVVNFREYQKSNPDNPLAFKDELSKFENSILKTGSLDDKELPSGDFFLSSYRTDVEEFDKVSNLGFKFLLRHRIPGIIDDNLDKMEHNVPMKSAYLNKIHNDRFFYPMSLSIPSSSGKAMIWRGRQMLFYTDSNNIGCRWYSDPNENYEKHPDFLNLVTTNLKKVSVDGLPYYSGSFPNISNDDGMITSKDTVNCWFHVPSDSNIIYSCMVQNDIRDVFYEFSFLKRIDKKTKKSR